MSGPGGLGDSTPSSSSPTTPPCYVSAAFEFLARRKDNTNSADSEPQFPADKVARFMQAKKLADELEGGAAIYMAAVLNYLAAEILELAGDAAHTDNNSRIIVPRHLKSAILNDSELNRLMSSVAASSGGTLTRTY